MTPRQKASGGLILAILTFILTVGGVILATGKQIEAKADRTYVDDKAKAIWQAQDKFVTRDEIKPQLDSIGSDLRLIKGALIGGKGNQ